MESNNDGPADMRTPMLHRESWQRTSQNQSTEVNSWWKRNLTVTVCAVTISLGTFQNGFALSYTSPTQQAMTSDLNLSIYQYSVFASIVNIGAIVGAISIGVFCDRIGRKGALMVADIPAIIGWLGIAFAKDASVLYVARILTGFGIGIFSYMVPVFIADIAPQNTRGALVTLSQIIYGIGATTAYLLGIFINWRTLAALGALQCGLLLFGLIFLPESPRWLAKMRMTQQMETSLYVLRGYESDISVERDEINNSLASSTGTTSFRFADIREKRNWSPLLIGTGLLSLRQFSGLSSVLYYAGTILAIAGISNTNFVAFILSLFTLFSVVGTSFLLDRVGRRVLLIVSTAGVAGCLLLISVVFYIRDHLPGDIRLTVEILQVILLAAYLVIFGLGLMTIPWLLISEILPAHMKGVGGGVATLASWCSDWVVTLTANELLRWSPPGTFTIYGAFTCVTLVIVCLYAPETKGKSLEELQTSQDS